VRPPSPTPQPGPALDSSRDPTSTSRPGVTPPGPGEPVAIPPTASPEGPGRPTRVALYPVARRSAGRAFHPGSPPFQDDSAPRSVPTLRRRRVDTATVPGWQAQDPRSRAKSSRSVPARPDQLTRPAEPLVPRPAAQALGPLPGAAMAGALSWPERSKGTHQRLAAPLPSSRLMASRSTPLGTGRASSCFSSSRLAENNSTRARAAASRNSR